MIQLVAYQAAHKTEDVPWRCVECAHLTKHADSDIRLHMVAAHNFEEKRLRQEGGEIYLYPPSTPA